jgi:hypothetical protein
VTIAELIVSPAPEPKAQPKGMRWMDAKQIRQAQNLRLEGCCLFHLDPVARHISLRQE